MCIYIYTDLHVPSNGLRSGRKININNFGGLSWNGWGVKFVMCCHFHGKKTETHKQNSRTSQESARIATSLAFYSSQKGLFLETPKKSEMGFPGPLGPGSKKLKKS